MQMSGLIESGPWPHSVLLRQQPESVEHLIVPARGIPALVFHKISDVLTLACNVS